MKTSVMLENIRLEKLVHGGQCLAYIDKNSLLLERDSLRNRESQANRTDSTVMRDSQGSKTDNAERQTALAGAQRGRSADRIAIFVWGGLPGELVNVRITKKKSSYLEGVVSEVIEASPDRVEPREPDVYLSSSPWQIMTFQAENEAKQSILEESFAREGMDGVKWQTFVSGDQVFGYRNKVELGFWGDEQGVHYASYIRGTHGKRIVTQNALATDAINDVLAAFLAELNRFIEKYQMRAGDFKTVTFRSSSNGEVVAALFTKREDVDFSDFSLPEGIKGLVIYFSNPKSPASVPTKQLYITGDITLTDDVLHKHITYDVLSFFQVNLPVFEVAAKQIKKCVGSQPATDMYSGVGTIGIAVGANILVESDLSNIRYTQQNAPDGVKVVSAKSEDALEHIIDSQILIVDPPRAGLHKNVVERILEAAPPQVIYLSCNPSTQARDIKLLEVKYRISHAQGYNFFPRTPHIESLIVLERI